MAARSNFTVESDLAATDLQDLTYLQIIVRTPFQYITDLIVTLGRE
jgi:hypothetical protein